MTSESGNLPASEGSPAEHVAALRRQGVETVRVTYPDLHGICRGTDILLEEFATSPSTDST